MKISQERSRYTHWFNLHPPTNSSHFGLYHKSQLSPTKTGKQRIFWLWFNTYASLLRSQETLIHGTVPAVYVLTLLFIIIRKLFNQNLNPIQGPGPPHRFSSVPQWRAKHLLSASPRFRSCLDSKMFIRHCGAGESPHRSILNGFS